MYRRPNVCRGVAFAILFASSAAVAQQQPDAKAQAAASELYTQAKREMEAGDYARACPRLEAARKILPDHVRTGVTLAQCYDKAGQPASAWAELKRVRPLAEAQGRADKWIEIDAKVADLEGRVPRLLIEVPAEVGALPGFAITRNGTPIVTAQWGTAEPVDPGVYEIGATALGKAPWSARVEVKNPGKNVAVKVAPPWALPARVAEKPVAEAKDKTPSRPASAASSSWMRTAGFVGMGVGAAGLGVGAVLGGMALSRKGASNDGHCMTDDRCDQAGFDLRTEARALGNGSTAAFIVGGVVLGAGVALFVISPPGSKGREADEGQARASLLIGPSGLGIRGAW
jgi:hypothetical protein